MQLGSTIQGHIVFMDSSGSLKYYSRDRQECVTLDEGVYSDNRVMLKFNSHRDRLLFKKSKSCLQEYQLRAGRLVLAKEYEQDSFVIDDFLFAPAANRKAQEKYVLILSGDGVMKICSCEGDKERRFEIDRTGKNFKVEFSPLVSIGVVTFNRLLDYSTEHVAYLVELKEDRVEFVNKVSFTTDLGTSCFTQSSTSSSTSALTSS